MSQDHSLEISMPQDTQTPPSFFERSWVYIALFLLAINIFYFFGYSPDLPYGPSRSLWYVDFRFWASWISDCCWLALLGTIISTTISLFVPQNDKRMFLLRRSFYKKAVSFLFVFFVWAVWYNHAALPLTTIFSPVVSPITNHVESHYTFPLADFYTTGEGRSPMFWPMIIVVCAAIGFIAWRVWYHIKRWRKPASAATAVLLVGLLPIMLGADEPITPKKVETSVGIYDVRSKDDLQNFTADDIRKLVKMEDDRIRGAGKPPHPVLVYCFEERSFQYTAGKYDNAEIKYRLHVPSKVVVGKKYPLVVHLHGIGEAGKDNTLSLAHLHSILPLLIGPEQQDFFLLILQSPPEDRRWTFSLDKDGNLDIAVAAIDHIIHENPIDENKLNLFGLSSGGSGVWRLLLKYPDKFAAAVPASCGAPNDFQKLITLTHTAIWTFRNKKRRMMRNN